MKLAVVIALAGCNDLFGLGEPTLMPDANPAVPSCATGWQYRVPIEVHNTSPIELHDYQVQIHLDTATATRDHKLQPDAADLRFAAETGPFAHVIEHGIATVPTSVWVAVPVIPIGTSTFWMYYGNPLATAWQGGPTFVPDIIANASFEGVGGWTLEPPLGPQARLFPASTWSSDGALSLTVDEEVVGERAMTSSSAISQPITLPFGADYVIRFDLNVVAASNGGVNGSNDGSFRIEIGSLADPWELSGHSGNITGIHLDEETAGIGPGSVSFQFMARVTAGSGPGYAKGYVDNLRVRKYVSPEPTLDLGIEDACSPGS